MKLEYDEDGTPAFSILIPDMAYAGPSMWPLSRIGMEFVSPEWLVSESIGILNTAAKEIHAGDAEKGTAKGTE